MAMALIIKEDIWACPFPEAVTTTDSAHSTVKTLVPTPQNKKSLEIVLMDRKKKQIDPEL